MKVANNTIFTLEEIQTFPLLGITINNWRGRRISLYQHPTMTDYVVSVGTTFYRSLQVIATETKSGWATALDYAEHGKVYTSE